MLENCALPQLEEFQANVMIEQDDAPPHWSVLICDRLNATFPNRWIGCDGIIQRHQMLPHVIWVLSKIVCMTIT